MLRDSFIQGLFVATFVLAPAAGRAADGVAIQQQPEKLVITINGQPFTDYVIAGAPHVYFYPVLGPAGASMTRNWPMKEVEGEERDHKHHRSLWYSHGLVNGVDFWAESDKSGRIVHDKFLEVKEGKDSGVIRSANKWIAPNGDVTLTDERTFRVFARPGNERVFDFRNHAQGSPGQASRAGRHEGRIDGDPRK